MKQYLTLLIIILISLSGCSTNKYSIKRDVVYLDEKWYLIKSDRKKVEGVSFILCKNYVPEHEDVHFILNIPKEAQEKCYFRLYLPNHKDPIYAGNKAIYDHFQNRASEFPSKIKKL